MAASRACLAGVHISHELEFRVVPHRRGGEGRGGKGREGEGGSGDVDGVHPRPPCLAPYYPCSTTPPPRPPPPALIDNRLNPTLYSAEQLICPEQRRGIRPYIFTRGTKLFEAKDGTCTCTYCTYHKVWFQTGGYGYKHTYGTRGL